MSVGSRKFKKIMLVIFSVLLLVSVFNIGTVFAGEKTFKVQSAIISEKSDGVEAKINSFDNDDVNADVVFHKLDDYVIFKITIQNTTNKKYTIRSVKDNESSNEIDFEYDSYEGEEISKKGTIDFYVKEVYENEANIQSRIQGKGVKLSFVMVDENGNVVSDDLIINPKTGDNLLFYIIIGILSLLCIVLIAVRNKRIKMLMMVSLLVLPIITYAALPSLVVKLNYSAKLFDKILVEKTVNGETVQELVEYNTPIEKPENPKKEGYDFDNWYANGHVYGFDTPLTEDTELVAHFTPKTYSIDYDLDGGSEEENPTTYTIETSSFTLKYPTKQGYVFSGWTGSNGTNIEKNVTISKGTTGNKNYVAHYNPSTNTPYKVLHKKQDLGLTTYTLADTDNLTGTTGTNVTPDLKNYEGFNKPEKQTKEIKPDGSTEFVYEYTRKSFSFEVSDKTYLDTTNSTEDGSYPYETEITVKAKDRQGYTFEKWSNNMQGQTLTFKLESNTSIYPIYVERGDTPYKVIHKKQNITCDGYDVAETENLTGKTNAEIHPAVKSYTGFTSPSVITTTISADGDTEVIYEYNRISYTLNVTDRTYLTSTSTENGSYPYETMVILSAVDRPGYDFSKWSNNNTNQTLEFTMSENVTIYPIYTPRTDTAYKVYHKKQDYNASTYTVFETENLTGTTGNEVTPATKSYTGFNSPAVQTKEIEADGSTEFVYEYTRKSFTFEVSDKTYLDTTNSTEDGSYLYETEITVKAVDRPGYDFTKWSNNETSQTATFTLSANTSIYPIYTAKTNTAYTVYHKWQDLTGDGYTTHETENLTGTTDQNVTPSVKEYTGFTSPSTQTKKINGDGSTEFEYKYDRNSYTLNVTDRTYLTSTSTANDSYPYETPITLSAVDRPGYDFTKWSNNNTNQTIQFNISEDVTIYPIYTAKDNTAYTVYHKWQDLTGDGYTTHETENLTGTTDQNVTPSVKEYTGFTSPSTVTKKINGDGSTVFEYKYNRIIYTFEVSDKTYLDTENSTADGSYRYGKEITAKALDRSGYDFVKWSNDNTNQTATFTLTEDTSIYPVYTPQGNIKYTIYHKKQSLDLSEYVVSETEELTGATGVPVTPAVKNYTGFTSPSTQTKPIEGDGSTVFEYKYDRNSYTLNVTDRTYLTSTSTANDSYPYETPITLSAVDRPGYDFTKWSNNETNQTLEFNLTEDTEIYPIYTAKTNTAYTVYHKWQDLTGDGYTTHETENLTGTTDQNVTPSVKEYTGFDSPATQTKKINGDGSTEFEYKYDRKTYTLNVTDRTYVTSASTANGTYRYGTQIILSASDRAGYDFTKWSNNETSQTLQFTISENVSIYPVYTAKTNTAYTVDHYKMDVDGENYTYVETDNLTGTTDQNVTPAVKNYDYFTSPETQTKKINGDGSTTFRYDYERNKYTLNATRTYLTASSTSNGEYYYETPITLSAVDRAGYNFVKWSNNNTNQTIQFNISEDVTIHPIYEEVAEYTVILNANGGNVSPSSITVTAGEEIGELPTPTHTDSTKTFEGWFTEETGGDEVDSSFVPEGDDEIFAHWTSTSSILCKKAMIETLHHETCNQTGSTGCSAVAYQNGQIIEYGNVAYNATFTPGNAFDCNVDGSGYNQRFYYVTTTDNKAVLISNENFNGANGQGDNDSNYVYNTAVTMLPTTTQWSNLPITFEITENNTRAARFIKLSELEELADTTNLTDVGSLEDFVFLFENSKYSGITERSTQWVLEEANGNRMRYRNDSRNIATLKSSEMNTSKNCVRPVIEIPMSQMETTTVHLITLNPNGGNFSGSTDNKLKTVLDTQKVGELPTPTRSAHQFGGWYTGVNSGVLVDENYVVNGETTLFARWIKNPAYVITFETNGGDPIDSIEIDQGEQIGELPLAERDGYLFEGWYLEPELENKVSETYIPEGNTILYANWEEIDPSYVAIRDGKYLHTTLADAISNASTSGVTNIKLLQDITTAVQVSSSYNIKLNLNGHSIVVSDPGSNNGVITNAGTLEVMNGTLTNNATNSSHAVRSNSGGTITLRNVTMNAKTGSGAVDNENGSNMTLIDCTVVMTGTRQGVYNNGGTITIKGNTTITNKEQRAAVHNKSNGVLNIESGTIITETGYAALYSESGTVTIGKEDGEIASKPEFICNNTDSSKSVAILVKSTTVNFYDGIFKGRVNLLGITSNAGNTPTISSNFNDVDTIDTYINSKEDESELVVDTEEIDNNTYKTLTLSFGDKWIISLDADGGTVNPQSLKIDKGSAISGLPTPVKGLYNFEGWYDENDNLIEDGYVPTSSMQLHAVWEYEGSEDIVEFRTTNDAMKVYYQNIASWKDDSSNFPTWSDSNKASSWALDATENAAMKVNFDNNNCECADNQCTSSGTVKCDKPNGYNLGIVDDFSIYLSSTNKEKGAKIEYAKVVNGVIYNLIPGQIYYWELDSDHNIHGYIKPVGERRILETGDVRNTRDLGGLPVDTDGNGTIDGHLAYGRLFRGIRLPSASSVTELTRLGINSELDLREANSDTNRLSRYNRIEAQNYYVNPLNYVNNPNSTTLQEKNYYDMTRAGVKYAMEEIVANKNLYFHCRIGTDRTGTVAWVLEGLLGVPEEDRIQDYELSFFYGLIRIHRYHNQKPGSSVGTGYERFTYMHNFMPTNSKIYDWYMYGTDDEDADKDLIEAFRSAMIVSN